MRPRTCPRCGRDRIVEILTPDQALDPQLRADLEERRAVVASNPPTGNDPRWLCLRCRWEWGHPHGLSGASAGGTGTA